LGHKCDHKLGDVVDEFNHIQRCVCVRARARTKLNFRLPVPHALPLEPDVEMRDRFDFDFLNRMNMFVTDKTVSFVATHAIPEDVQSTFAFELATQLVVAFLITLGTWMIKDRSFVDRVTVRVVCAAACVTNVRTTQLTLLTALTTCVATYAQLYNWRGYTALCT
jgi:hypothetical protein